MTPVLPVAKASLLRADGRTLTTESTDGQPPVLESRGGNEPHPGRGMASRPIMRVGLDAHTVLWRPTGAGTYLLGLLPELLKLLADEEEIVVLQKGDEEPPDELAWIRHPRLKTVRAHVESATLGWLWRLLPFPPLERFSGRLDVCHSLRSILPPSQAALRVVTFHNLPPTDTAGEPEERTYPGVVRHSARQADVLITPSRGIKERVIRALGVPPEKIEVIPYGAGRRLLQAPKPADVEAFCDRYPYLQEPYLLAVGTAQPRKNFPFLIRAYARARAMAPKLPRLVLLTSPGRDSEAIAREIATTSLDAETLVIEYLEPQFLAFLYRGAELFLHPAQDGGFGLPLLEAAASGIASLASPTCGALEVISDGVFVPVGDEEAWACEMVRLHGDEGARKSAAERAQPTAAACTWEEAARRHWEIYRRTPPPAAGGEE